MSHGLTGAIGHDGQVRARSYGALVGLSRKPGRSWPSIPHATGYGTRLTTGSERTPHPSSREPTPSLGCLGPVRFVFLRPLEASTVTTTEGFIDVPGGKVWYKRVGRPQAIPLLVLHGGPGFCHDYLESLEVLGDQREVYFFDQLGCGKSDIPTDDSLWTVDFYVEEVAVVAQALGLERYHLFGNSWGGMLAMAFVLDRQPALVSLAVSNSPASMPRFLRDNLELKKELPQEIQESIDWHEANGFTKCPEYQAATALWYQKHICRMRPWAARRETSI
jgi:hypothetical protein